MRGSACRDEVAGGPREVVRVCGTGAGELARQPSSSCVVLLLRRLSLGRQMRGSTLLPLPLSPFSFSLPSTCLAPSSLPASSLLKLPCPAHFPSSSFFLSCSFSFAFSSSYPFLSVSLSRGSRSGLRIGHLRLLGRPPMEVAVASKRCVVLVLHWDSAGTASTLPWNNVGADIVLTLHCIGTTLALYQ